MAPDLGLRIMEDDSEEHPSVELAGDVQDGDLGVDNKQVELLEFTSSFMFPAESCRGVLEIEAEAETWELIVLLSESGEDLTVKFGAQPDPPNSFPKGAAEEDDFTGGVELRIILHESLIQVFFDTILVLPEAACAPLSSNLTWFAPEEALLLGAADRLRFWQNIFGDLINDLDSLLGPCFGLNREEASDVFEVLPLRVSFSLLTFLVEVSLVDDPSFDFCMDALILSKRSISRLARE